MSAITSVGTRVAIGTSQESFEQSFDDRMSPQKPSKPETQECDQSVSRDEIHARAVQVFDREVMRRQKAVSKVVPSQVEKDLEKDKTVAIPDSPKSVELYSSYVHIPYDESIFKDFRLITHKA